jgi:LssY C-terminus
MNSAEPGQLHPRRHRHRKIRIMGGIVLLWLVASYLLIPLAWEYYAARHPAFDHNPRVTETSDRHPGDPLNVALIGTEDEVRGIMKAAKWYPAAGLGIISDLRIGADTILKRPDDDAPVSNLYLFGRKEDLAFEQPVGNSPRHRHHVRLWKTAEASGDGRPQWIGAAVYDEKVGLSRTTGQITHVTAADVDVERDYLFQCLDETNMLDEWYMVKNFHQKRSGRNGGGDLWKTDGSLYVGVITVE